MNIRHLFVGLLAAVWATSTQAAGTAVIEASGLERFDGEIIEYGYVDPTQRGGFEVLGLGFIEEGGARIEAPIDMPTNAQVRIVTGDRKPVVGQGVIAPGVTTEVSLNGQALRFSGGDYQSLIYPEAAGRESEVQTFDRLSGIYLNEDDAVARLLSLQAAWLDGEDEAQVAVLDELRGEFGDALSIRIMDAHTAARVEELRRAMKDFTAMTLAGEEVRLADVLKQNKYTLVEFWASWCGPCIAEIPNLKANYAKYRDLGFEILSVNLDEDREAWQIASEEKYNIEWINASDGQVGFGGPIASLYRVKGIPSTYLVAPDGKRVASQLRGEALGDKLAELFAE